MQRRNCTTRLQLSAARFASGDCQRLQREADRSIGPGRWRPENRDVGKDLSRNCKLVIGQIARQCLVGLLGIWTRDAKSHFMPFPNERERLPIR